jgi:hypothetical protein
MATPAPVLDVKENIKKLLIDAIQRKDAKVIARLLKQNADMRGEQMHAFEIALLSNCPYKVMLCDVVLRIGTYNIARLQCKGAPAMGDAQSVIEYIISHDCRSFAMSLREGAPAARIKFVRDKEGGRLCVTPHALCFQASNPHSENRWTLNDLQDLLRDLDKSLNVKSPYEWLEDVKKSETVFPF